MAEGPKSPTARALIRTLGLRLRADRTTPGSMPQTVRIIDNQTPRPDDQIAVKRLTPKAVSIDDISVGRGISGRLKEMGSGVHGLSVSGQPQDETKYPNLKSETYWNARSWVLAGGKLKRDDRFLQLAWIKDKVTTDKVIQIAPKVELN